VTVRKNDDNLCGGVLYFNQCSLLFSQVRNLNCSSLPSQNSCLFTDKPAALQPKLCDLSHNISYTTGITCKHFGLSYISAFYCKLDISWVKIRNNAVDICHVQKLWHSVMPRVCCTVSYVACHKRAKQAARQ